MPRGLAVLHGGVDHLPGGNQFLQRALEPLAIGGRIEAKGTASERGAARLAH